MKCSRSPFYEHSNTHAGCKFEIDGTEVRKAHVKLGRPLVPRFFWPHLEATNDNTREDYFRRLIFTFIPWRDEDKLKEDERMNVEYATYEERWYAFTKELETGDDEEKTALQDIRGVM